MNITVPTTWDPPSADREFPVFARFGANYSRNTVSYQRRKVREALGLEALTRLTSQMRYGAEMKRSRCVVSPFGWGEITYRDFQAFLCGCLLIKPDMSHVETWPDLYVRGETYVKFSWDVADLPGVLADVNSRYERYVEVARTAQQRYSAYLTSGDAEERFSARALSVFRTGSSD